MRSGETRLASQAAIEACGEVAPADRGPARGAARGAVRGGGVARGGGAARPKPWLVARQKGQGGRGGGDGCDGGVCVVRSAASSKVDPAARRAIEETKRVHAPYWRLLRQAQGAAPRPPLDAAPSPSAQPEPAVTRAAPPAEPPPPPPPPSAPSQVGAPPCAPAAEPMAEEPAWSPSTLFASPYLPPPTPPPLRERLERLQLGGHLPSHAPSQAPSQAAQAGAENPPINGVGGRQEGCTGSWRHSLSGGGAGRLIFAPARAA